MLWLNNAEPTCPFWWVLAVVKAVVAICCSAASGLSVQLLPLKCYANILCKTSAADVRMSSAMLSVRCNSDGARLLLFIVLPGDPALTCFH